MKIVWCKFRLHRNEGGHLVEEMHVLKLHLHHEKESHIIFYHHDAYVNQIYNNSIKSHFKISEKVTGLKNLPSVQLKLLKTKWLLLFYYSCNRRNDGRNAYFAGNIQIKKERSCLYNVQAC